VNAKNAKFLKISVGVFNTHYKMGYFCRRHINTVKQGGEYFHILHQESLEQKNALKAQKSQTTIWRTDFQPCEYSSEVEVSDEEMNR